jgi:uncharacterized protein YprB with RNaseH-like and TPR domain
MKILLFDIETSPIEAHVWDMYETNVLNVLKDSHLMSFAYRWYGKDKTHVRALPDYQSYKKNKRDDAELVKDLWHLFNEADIIIGHNGDSFDIKKSQARFIHYGLPPVPPVKTIDTLKLCRKYFKFSTNKLDAVGKLLGVGRKEKTGGFDLWLDCLAGDPKAWKRMKKYNKQDVVLLEAVYEKLRPWMTNHPNTNSFEDRHYLCEVCGSAHFHKKGVEVTKTSRYIRLHCQGCGKWKRGDKI